MPRGHSVLRNLVHRRAGSQSPNRVGPMTDQLTMAPIWAWSPHRRHLHHLRQPVLGKRRALALVKPAASAKAKPNRYATRVLRKNP